MTTAVRTVYTAVTCVYSTCVYSSHMCGVSNCEHVVLMAKHAPNQARGMTITIVSTVQHGLNMWQCNSASPLSPADGADGACKGFKWATDT